MTKALVLISTYNGEQYIDQQIKSVIEQTHNHVDILIRDDGSTDQTSVKLSQWTKQTDRITLIKSNNVGVVSSFMHLIQEASDDYDYYCFCDQDDVWLPNKVNNAVTMLAEYQIPAMVCTATQMVDTELNMLNIWPYEPSKPISFNNAVIENIAVGATITFNKGAMKLLKDKNIDPSKLIMHDWWVYLVVSAFGVVLFDPNPSIFYRQHTSNLVGGNRSLVHKWIKRLKILYVSSRFKSLKEQALEFYKHYKYQLSNDHREQLELFVSDRNSLQLRVNFVKKSKLYRQSWFEQRLFQFLILTGYI